DLGCGARSGRDGQQPRRLRHYREHGPRLLLLRVPGRGPGRGVPTDREPGGPAESAVELLRVTRIRRWRRAEGPSTSLPVDTKLTGPRPTMTLQAKMDMGGTERFGRSGSVSDVVHPALSVTA